MGPALRLTILRTPLPELGPISVADQSSLRTLGRVAASAMEPHKNEDKSTKVVTSPRLTPRMLSMNNLRMITCSIWVDVAPIARFDH